MAEIQKNRWIRSIADFAQHTWHLSARPILQQEKYRGRELSELLDLDDFDDFACDK